MKQQSKLEKTIQAEIEAEIGAEPDLIILKNSVGLARHYDDEGKSWKVPYGLGTGSPDLVGILAPWGRWFCIEVKVPGEEPDPHQLKCHEQWRAMGALVYVATSATEARHALAAARTASNEASRA